MTGLSIWIWFLLLGILLGWMFFGGLWLTVKGLTQTRYPRLLALLSFFIRVAIAVSCFYLAAGFGSWQGTLLCLAGFMVMQFFLAHHLGKTDTIYRNTEKKGPGYDY